MDGEAYGFGSNEYGQVGCDDSQEVLAPQKIYFSEQRLLLADPETGLGTRIAKLTVGPCHNFAFSDEGEIYTWGLGSYGQLGNGHLGLKQPYPACINEDWGPETLQRSGSARNIVGSYLDVGNIGVTGNPSPPRKNEDPIRSLIFPKDKVKKYLPSVVVNLWFDCSIVLVSKLDPKRDLF